MKYKTGVLAFIFIAACGYIGFPQNSTDPIIIEDEVRIIEYLPFNENSKTAKLHEEPALKIAGDIPNLDGATALYPVYASFVNAVYPYGSSQPGGPYWLWDINNSKVMCNRTAEAYTNLINGRVEIIFCAEPSGEQTAMAAEKGLKFNMTPIGKDAFVFFVNKTNPVNNISSSQIRSIYSGSVTNWRDIGGRTGKIIPYQRPKNSGSQTILEAIMGGRPVMEPLKENVAGGMGGIVERVAVYKNYQDAIGFSFLFFTTEMTGNNEIKILSIDNIFPAKETIRTSEYPFGGTFYAITVGNESENAKKFIEWILSPQGQYLIEKTGYVPLK
jgi:phosphate transport system substrate-binding protein